MKSAQVNNGNRLKITAAIVTYLASCGLAHAQVSASIPGVVDVKIGEKGISAKVEGVSEVNIGDAKAKGTKATAAKPASQAAAGPMGKCVNGVLRVANTGTGNSQYSSLSCDRVEIYVKAVGNITVGTVNAKSVVIGSSGTGDLNIQSLTTDALDIVVDAVGSVKIAQGNADRLKIVNDGTGNIDAARVTVNTVTANISAAGSATINANRTIDVNLSGTGDLMHAGPATVNAQVSGVGSAKPL